MRNRKRESRREEETTINGSEIRVNNGSGRKWLVNTGNRLSNVFDPKSKARKERTKKTRKKKERSTRVVNQGSAAEGQNRIKRLASEGQGLKGILHVFGERRTC
jgi:hypothetical protein